jgi:ABC-type Fe3+-hydroxamate transport system substrate-binding protein
MTRRSLLAMVGLALTCVAMLVVMAGCEKKPTTPVVRDDAGTSPRLAVLSPALAATLDDLGLGAHVVGRHAWDLVLDPSLPVVGDGLGEVDYERLAAVKPDLVLGQFGASGIPARLNELAGMKGWTVRDYNPLSLADVTTTARALARDLESAGLVGVLDRLDTLEADLTASLTPRASAGKAGRVLLLAEVSPPAALGPGSVHYDMLVRLGATPAISAGAAYITLDAEDLSSLAPDAVMIVMPRARDAVPPTAATTLPVVAGLTTARIVVIDDPLTHLPATTIRRTAAQMGDALDAWAKP